MVTDEGGDETDCVLARASVRHLGTVHAEDRPMVTPSIPLAEPYIIGVGLGDLSKGRVVCERVAELAARADVAKQIRVVVKEEIRDHVRERTGRAVEQDIEIVREEHVSELLERVRIVERKRRCSHRDLYE
ncbi:MAG: hypothetical protein M3Z35_11560 [Nitrospirota bacterium]|nr:hypothetical protein [Nitrospirota bacterium]